MTHSGASAMHLFVEISLDLSNQAANILWGSHAKGDHVPCPYPACATNLALCKICLHRIRVQQLTSLVGFFCFIRQRLRQSRGGVAGQQEHPEPCINHSHTFATPPMPICAHHAAALLQSPLPVRHACFLLGGTNCCFWLLPGSINPAHRSEAAHKSNLYKRGVHEDACLRWAV